MLPPVSPQSPPPSSEPSRTSSVERGHGSVPRRPVAQSIEQDAPPYDNRGHPSICFVVEQFRLASSSNGAATVASSPSLDGSSSPGQVHDQQRTRVRVATCLRKDPSVDRRAWWNLADGVFLTKFVAEDPPATPSQPQTHASLPDQAGFPSQTSHDPLAARPTHGSDWPAPTTPAASPWVMDPRGEIHLGDQMANLPQGVVTSIQTTFNFPLAVSLAYLHGFTNGTHANLVHRTALYYASDAPWKSLQRAANLWVDVWRHASNRSTSA